MNFAIITKSITGILSMVWFLISIINVGKNFAKDSTKENMVLEFATFTPCLLNQFLLNMCQTFPVKDWHTFVIPSLIISNLGPAIAIIWGLARSRRCKNN